MAGEPAPKMILVGFSWGVCSEDTCEWGVAAALWSFAWELVGEQLWVYSLEGFQDLEGRVSVVGGVEQLGAAEFASGPITRCDGLGFAKLQIEQDTHRGTHADLLAQQGRYAQMWALQKSEAVPML